MADYVFDTVFFDDLTVLQLYKIIQLRTEIFVVEQNCVYQDLDDRDMASYHVMTRRSEELVAYARILPQGVAYDSFGSIGRVIVAKKQRGIGLGKGLMLYALHAYKALFGESPLKISAQCYLINFYRKLGFDPVGQAYLEDDIPHIAMEYQWKKFEFEFFTKL